MNIRSVEIGGSQLFWDLSDTARAALAPKFRSLGFEEHIPAMPTNKVAVRVALAEHYKPTTKTEKIVIRPLKQGEGDGFAVVKEDKAKEVSEGDTWGTVVATVTVKDDPEGGEDTFDDYCFDVTPDPGYDAISKMRETFRGVKNTISPTNMGNTLVSIAESMKCVSMRRKGGLYWLNIDKRDEFIAVADAVEAAAIDKGTSEVHVLDMVANERMVRAVGSGLTREVTAALDDIQAEIDSGDLGEQACFNRQKKANALLGKVKNYEEAFAVELKGLTERAAAIETAACIAGLQLAASASPLCGQDNAAADANAA